MSSNEKIAWTNRQNNSNGNTKTANIYVSADGQNWGTPQLITIASVTTKQLINLTSKDGQYVKVEILTNQAGTDISSIAELGFYGCKNVITKTQEIESITYNIYPNPFVDVITVEGNDISSIQIINSNGQNVMSQNVTTFKTSFNVSELRKGIYFVKVKANGKESIQKIVK